MISSDTISRTVASYAKACKVAARSPTRQALAQKLGISPRTLGRVIDGMYYPGKPYTNHPSDSRLISNSDFEIIQALFS